MVHSRFCLLILFGLLAFPAGSAPRPHSTPKRPQARSAPTASAPAERNAAAKQAVDAGLVQRDLHNFGKARALFERALRLAIPAGDVEVQAEAHNGLGLVAQDLGKLQEALTEYRKALEFWPKAGKPAEQAETLSNLGQVLLVVGQTDEALAALNQALRLLGPEDREVRFGILDGVGMAHHDLGARKQALLMYELALKLAKTPIEEARIRSRIGIVYRDEEDYERAVQELDKARRLARGAGDTQWEAYALADLAHIEDLRGQDEDALRTFDKAFSLLEASPKSLPKASVLFGRAEVLRDLGRLEEAIASVERSVKLVEPVRAELVDPRLRVDFFSWRQRYYELYVTLLMDRYRRDRTEASVSKAFEASDRSHSRSLLDDIAGAPTTKGSSLEEIQRELLDSDTTLLAYALGDRGSFLWVVNQNRITSFDLPRRARIEEAASAAWTRLSESGGGSEVETLSRILLPDGVEPLLRRNLLISPDGALHVIPFSMLHRSDGRLLILDHVVSSLPSASYFVGMRRRLASRRPAPKQLVVLADPVFERDDPRLFRLKSFPREIHGAAPQPFLGPLDRLVLSRQEAHEILRLVPAASRREAFNFAASRRTAMDPSLASYRMIHITTHYIDSPHPEFAGLVLSLYDERGRPQDGLLRASEIYGLNFPADLVVLSACGSGLGPRVPGEGPMGMTRAFFHAGAKRVVVSLWDVQDNATTELMTRFYRQMLQGGLPPSEALRSAQLSMANDPNPKWRSSPSWAAFVLQGESR